MAETPRPIDVAFTLHTRGRLDEAEARYRAIVAANPAGQEAMDARNNLLDVYQQQHRWADAEGLIREALAIQPASGDWSFRLGAELLAQGRYAEAWPLYEARRAMTRNRVTAPSFPFPEWRGEPVGRLLVWLEQGRGDMIQFARFLPALRAQGIAVALVCTPDLVRLLRPLADQVIALSGETRVPAADAWCLIASLPRLLGATLETLPGPALAAPGGAGEQGRGGKGIGVATRGSATHFNNHIRSLPDDVAAELLALPGAVDLDPAATGAKDFQDTAEIVASLERVISVDTAQAHLAASIGKPTAILLAHLHTDWRWLRGRADSPWYPSARLYRQPAAGDWRTPVAALRAELGL